METLDQKVRVMDRKMEVQAEADQAKAKDAPVLKASAQGFSISSPNDDWSIKFGGIIQADGRFFASGDDKTGSTFFLNRVRPIITGTLGKYYEYNITPDFGRGTVVLQDAYINTTYFQDEQFQVGKMKAPFSLERLQSDRDLLFSERSETDNLVPNRDIGAELHADSLFEGRLTYQLALMNGVPNRTAQVDSDLNDGKDFYGRLFALPFKNSEYEWARGLGVGFAGSYGDENNNTINTYRTYGNQAWFTFNKGVTAAGTRWRIEPQAYYFYRSFGFQTEFDSDTQALNLNGMVTKGKTPVYVNNYSTFTDTGYMAQASYVLTGENASYKGVKPRKPFDPMNGTIGAVELATRISNVAVDSGVFKLGYANLNTSANNATEMAFGLNWYLSQNIKWQFDYAYTYFNGGAGPSPKTPQDRPAESVFETQFQLAF